VARGPGVEGGEDLVDGVAATIGVAGVDHNRQAELDSDLDLSGEGTVSDYKKLLQDIIWAERGHPRDLAEFLLANGLLTRVDLDQARKIAMANERSGKTEMTRRRLQYLKRK